MKANILLFILLSVIAFGCGDRIESNDDSDSLKVDRPIYPKTGNYFETANPGENLILADPIIYDVVVKNPDPVDEWTEYCLSNTDIVALSKIIFNAVYQGKLIPYYYRSDDSILPIDSIRKIEMKFGSEKIGKIQFNEQWFFDENKLEFYKKINSITFGYEIENDMGEVYGYRPAFKVYFGKKNNQIAK